MNLSTIWDPSISNFDALWPDVKTIWPPYCTAFDAWQNYWKKIQKIKKWAAHIKPMQHYQAVVVCTKQYAVESFPTIALFRLWNNCFFHFNGIFLVIKWKSVILNATEKPCRLYSWYSVSVGALYFLKCITHWQPQSIFLKTQVYTVHWCTQMSPWLFSCGILLSH